MRRSAGGIPGLCADLPLRLCARGHAIPHISPLFYWQHIGALNLYPNPSEQGRGWTMLLKDMTSYILYISSCKGHEKPKLTDPTDKPVYPKPYSSVNEPQ